MGDLGTNKERRINSMGINKKGQIKELVKIADFKKGQFVKVGDLRQIRETGEKVQKDVRKHVKKTEETIFHDFKGWKETFVRNRRKLALSLIFIIIAIILNFVSGFYVERVGEANPQDLILDNIPVLDFSFINIWLFIAVVVIIFVYPFLYHPRKIAHVIGIVSLFIVVRAGFAVLTHLQTPHEAIKITSVFFIYNLFSFSNYLFFSGHVGLPFLGYLLYKNNKYLKYFMLTSSIILAVIALFMHTNYSIDVLSAFFITYGVYQIGDFIFQD